MNNKIFNCVLIIIVVIIIIINHNTVNEGFANYTRCSEKPVKGIMKRIFEQFNINKDDDKWDIYIPCGYNKVEYELKNIYSNKDQKIFGISGCDKIVSKNNLWNILNNYYGREKARTIMPESFLLSDSSDIDILEQQFNNNDTYILKKNLQRKKGLELTRDFNTIKNSYYRGFKVVQRYLNDVFIINKRKMNLRMYMLVVCTNNNKTIYIHKQGKCLYTSKDVTNKNSLDFDENITNSYKLDKNIYNNNPLTINNLKDYLDKNNYDSKLLFDKINKILVLLAKAITKPLCNLSNIKKNTTFQLFGLDVIFDTKLNPYLLEINKGPEMGAKNDIDKKLKTKVQLDMFEKINIINIDDPNYINEYEKLI
jgi:hypothetical protein